MPSPCKHRIFGGFLAAKACPATRQSDGIGGREIAHHFAPVSPVEWVVVVTPPRFERLAPGRTVPGLAQMGKAPAGPHRHGAGTFPGRIEIKAGDRQTWRTCGPQMPRGWGSAYRNRQCFYVGQAPSARAFETIQVFGIKLLRMAFTLRGTRMRGGPLTPSTGKERQIRAWGPKSAPSRHDCK
jgi:hypothetical protein